MPAVEDEFTSSDEGIAGGESTLQEMMLRGTVEIMHRHLQTDSQGNPLQENEATR